MEKKSDFLSEWCTSHAGRILAVTQFSGHQQPACYELFRNSLISWKTQGIDAIVLTSDKKTAEIAGQFAATALNLQKNKPVSVRNVIECNSIDLKRRGIGSVALIDPFCLLFDSINKSWETLRNVIGNDPYIAFATVNELDGFGDAEVSSVESCKNTRGTSQPTDQLGFVGIDVQRSDCLWISPVSEWLYQALIDASKNDLQPVDVSEAVLTIRPKLNLCQELNSSPMPVATLATHRLHDGAIEPIVDGSLRTQIPTLAEATNQASHANATVDKQRLLLSLCMIVRDNESIIGECLESIRPWVDEMIVVDTGSTDNTAEIVRRLGAQVFSFPWCDDFSAARNESLRHANGQWLFWMDSDDLISPENGQRLRELVADNHHPDVLGFVMQVHCPGESREQDVTIVDHVKVFRNHPELRFEGRIHEQILPAIRRLNGEVKWTDVFVFHQHGARKGTARKSKQERDLRLLQIENAEKPDHPFTLFNLGMTYADMADFNLAVDALCRSIMLADRSESQLRKAYALLASSWCEMHRFEQALVSLEKGLELFPNDRELLFRQGVVLHQIGNVDEAITSYERSLESKNEQQFSSVDVGISGFKARHNLALACRDANQQRKAERNWEAVIAEQPSFLPAWIGLLHIAFSQNNLPRAKSLLRRAKKDSRIEVATTLMESEILSYEKKTDQALNFLEKQCTKFPDEPEIWRSLSKIVFELGDMDKAESSLQKLATLCPTDAATLHNLASVYCIKKSYEQAAHCCQQSLELSPDRTQTRELLSSIVEMSK